MVERHRGETHHYPIIVWQRKNSLSCFEGGGEQRFVAANTKKNPLHKKCDTSLEMLKIT